ncbi:MAG: aminoglycoside phosphotransferase family protein, partial [Pseudomonadota bacterium]
MVSDRDGPDPEALWEVLAPAAGLDPHAFIRDKTWTPPGTREGTFVVRFASQEAAYVLKSFNQRMPLDRFQRITQTMRAASAGMVGNSRVVRILATSEERRGVLYEWLDGQELYARMEEESDHRDLLTRMGTWFAEFQRLGGLEDGKFWPKRHVEDLQALRRSSREGEITVCDASDFRDAITMTIARVREARAAPAASSWQHGDPNLHNFMVSGDTLTALDFTRVMRGHIAHDIAHFLAFYGALMEDIGRLKAGEILSAESLHAFHAGYDLMGSDDPTLRALLPMKLLHYWQ